MSKARVKFAIFIAGLAVVGLVGVLAFTLLTQFIVSFQQGADPASIFRGAQLIIPEPQQVVWMPDINPAGRIPSQAQREEIMAAYWQAWRALSRAQEIGDTSDLLSYWAGSAYKQLVVDPERPVTQEDWRHRLRLRFFSSDGTVVAFDDKDFMFRQTVGEYTLETSANASVVMTVDNGYWRVRVLTISYLSE